jgi:hypothetical protein
MTGRDGPLSFTMYAGAPCSAASSSLSLSLLNLLSAAARFALFAELMVGTPAIVSTGSSAGSSSAVTPVAAQPG